MATATLPVRVARYALGLLALWLLAGGPALAAGLPQAAPSIELRAQAAFGGVYRPGSWLPILIDLENSGVDRAVDVQVGARSSAQFAERVELPNNSRKSLVIYAYLPTAAREITVRLLVDRAELRSVALRLNPGGLRGLQVGVLANAGARIALPRRLPDDTPLGALPLALADLPDQAIGLSGFDALIIDDMPTADLRPAQAAALQEWVLRGGQLIIGGGDGAARALAGLPAALRPVAAGPATPTAASAILGPAAGADPLPVASYTPLADAVGRLPYALPFGGVSPDLNPPLAVEQRLGQGSVAFVAVPLGQPALAAWPDLPQLWAGLLHPSDLLPAGFAPQDLRYDSFVEGNLAATLTNLPALTFPPLLTTGLLLLAYILTVGPGVYLLLRWRDRLSWGWILVPAITLLFGAVLYGVGYAQRGGDLVVSQVTLIEPAGGPGLARMRSFAGVFSPGQASYNLTASYLAPGAAAPLLRPISLQGPWDAGSAVGGVFRQGQADDFAIAQWAMRAVVADTVGPYPGLDAQLLLSGGGLRAEVRNRSAQIFRDVSMVQGGLVARLGDIPPGEARSGELRSLQQNGGFGSGAPLSYTIYAAEMDALSKAGGAPLPAELQLRTRILDALFSYGPAPRSGQPLLLAWSDEPVLALQAAGLRADQRQIGVILATPRLVVPPGEIDLGQGWLAPHFESGAGNVCFGGQGSGVVPGTTPTVLQLALPRDLYGVRAERLTLLTGSDGPWPAGTTVEIYDWAAGGWEAQPVSGGSLELPEPGRFLSGHGQLRLRLAADQPQQNGGCVYLDAKLKGTMP